MTHTKIDANSLIYYGTGIYIAHRLIISPQKVCNIDLLSSFMFVDFAACFLFASFLCCSLC